MVRRAIRRLLARWRPGLGDVRADEGWFDDVEPDDLAG
jgi:hypothetical protein